MSQSMVVTMRFAVHSLDHVAPGGNYGGFQLVNFSDFTQPLVHHCLMFVHGDRNKSLLLYVNKRIVMSYLISLYGTYLLRYLYIYIYEV